MKQLRIIQILFFTIAINSMALAQTTTFELLPSSTLSFDGTSSIHDFTFTSTQLFAELTVSNPAQVTSLLDSGDFTLRVIVPVKKLSSGNESMDENMQEALLEEENPNIIYDLRILARQAAPDSSKGGYKLETTGDLTIAGTQREINMNLYSYETVDGIIHFKGSTTIDMTEWNVVPPSFMFGVMKTGKDVAVSFDIQFKRKQLP